MLEITPGRRWIRYNTGNWGVLDCDTKIKPLERCFLASPLPPSNLRRCSCPSFFFFFAPALISCLIIEEFLLLCLANSSPSCLAISKSLEPVTGQLSNTIAAKLTAVEVTLKDNVSKVVKSKASGRPFIPSYPKSSEHHPPLSPCPLPVYRTRQTPLAEQQRKQCRGPSRQLTKTPSRASCCLFLKEAASPCFSKLTTASNKAHMNVRLLYPTSECVQIGTESRYQQLAAEGFVVECGT